MNFFKTLQAASLCLLCLLCVQAQSPTTSQPLQAAPKTPPSQEASRQLPSVTINVKNGAPIHGKLIKADSDSVQIEVEKARRLSIGIDEVNSIVFADATSASLEASADVRTAETALKGLREMATAVEVGVNRRDYTNRLIEVKFAVEQSAAKMLESELKREILAALDDYAIASDVWDYTIKRVTGQLYNTSTSKFIRASEPMVQSLIRKYPDIKPLDPLSGSEPFVDREILLTAIWSSARHHIDKAADLLGRAIK
jgi:hypothetical protein